MIINLLRLQGSYWLCMENMINCINWIPQSYIVEIQAIWHEGRLFRYRLVGYLSLQVTAQFP